MCIFSHCVYKKSAKIINFLKTQKTPKKPNKTQKNPNPYPRKGQTGIGFFWVTPPPPKLQPKFDRKCFVEDTLNSDIVSLYLGSLVVATEFVR